MELTLADVPFMLLLKHLLDPFQQSTCTCFWPWIKKKTLDLIKKIDLQWNQHHVISYKTYQFQISQHLEYGLL